MLLLIYIYNTYLIQKEIQNDEKGLFKHIISLFKCSVICYNGLYKEKAWREGYGNNKS